MEEGRYSYAAYLAARDTGTGILFIMWLSVSIIDEIL